MTFLAGAVSSSATLCWAISMLPRELPKILNLAPSALKVRLAWPLRLTSGNRGFDQPALGRPSPTKYVLGKLVAASVEAAFAFFFL